MINIFDVADYRKYLNARLGEAGKRTGMKAAAAEALGCHTTYISRILSDRADLSLEQASALNSFLAHTKEEADFFLLLVLRARAGTTPLKAHFQGQIDAIISSRVIIKNRIDRNTQISPEAAARFYDSWIHGVIHVLVSIPNLRTREAIATYLKIPLEKVTESLTFLEQLGLISQKRDQFQHTSKMVHLGNDSGNIVKHHLNWRLRAMRTIEERGASDVHYSAAVSLSRKDAARIRQILVDNLKKNLDIIADSKEEVAYGYCFDFFELGG